jgi:hypothetical protein
MIGLKSCGCSTDGRILKRFFPTTIIARSFAEWQITPSAFALRATADGSAPIRPYEPICPSSGDSVEFCLMSSRANASRAKNRARVKSNFVSRFNLIWVVSSPRANISLSENQKLCTLPAVPFPQEGRFAVVSDVGSGMRWTLRRRVDERRLRWTAKACGPGAPTLALRSRDYPANDGGKRAPSPGSNEVAR